MKKVIIVAISILLTIVVVLGFVEEDKSEVDSYNEGIVYSMNTIPTNLEKITDLTKSEEDILCATSRGLVAKDLKGDIIPILAESYEEGDDGIEYVFNLRTDIYWSDGTVIKADDIRDFFKELIKSEDENNIESLLDVYGALEFRNGKGTFEKGVAISTEGNVLKIRLNKKNDDFLEDLTKIQYRIRKSLPLWRDMNTFYKDIIYSGEYYIEEMDKSTMKLEVNSSITQVSTKKIIVIKDDNKEVAMASFEVGKRDLVINPPENELNRLSDEKKLLTYPSNVGIYLVINEENEDFPLGIRSGVYKNMCEALVAYEGEFSKELEVAEGSYFRDDKEDLTKLQSRKVSINQGEEIIVPKELRICTEENMLNKSIYDFLSDWFKKNKSIELKFSIVSYEEIEELKANKKYDMLILKNENKNGNRESLYGNINNLLNKDEKNIFEEEKLEGEISYSALETELFSECRILPLGFLNDNICISNKIESIKYDYNGNLDFLTINN